MFKIQRPHLILYSHHYIINFIPTKVVFTKSPSCLYILLENTVSKKYIHIDHLLQ